MSKVKAMIFLVVLACIYAILTIKLDLFWKFGEWQKADNINDIIVNLSYSILAAVIFYVFIDIVPYYTKKRKMRQVLRTKIDRIKQDLNSAKNAIYLPPFTEVAKTRDEYITDFANKNLYDAYCLGIYGFKNIREYLEYNRTQIRNSILEILSYSDFLTEKEVKTLADINSSLYINEYLFIKDFEMIQIQPDLYNNQKEIGESIYNINELIKKIIKNRSCKFKPM